MNAVLDTRYFIFSNVQIYQPEIAFDRLFTKKKCSNVMNSMPYLIQSVLTMSICTRISYR